MSRRCPMCGSKQYDVIELVHMQLPTRLSLPDEYQIVSCVRCGGCYANTTARQEDYDHYYASYNNYSGQGADSLFEQILSLTEKFGELYLERSSNILDIGFGNGELLKHLQDVGYKNLFGIDPSVDSVNPLNRNERIQAYCKSVYDEPDNLANKMDAVFMISVLEHLLDPKIAIRQVCKYINDGGYLIVNVPDYSMCDQTQLPIPNQFNQEHINYFSEDSLRTLLVGMPCDLVCSKLLETNISPELGSEYNRVLILKKSAGKDSSTSFARDSLTRPAIERYFLKQRSLQGNINAWIHQCSVDQIPVIIWGTGAWTMSLLAGSDLSKCNIIAYADGNRLKIGTRFGGTEVIAPEKIKDYPDATILICAMKYADDIQEEIVKMGLQNPTVVIK